MSEDVWQFPGPWAVLAGVKALVFIVNSFTGQNFSTVKNAFCRLITAASGQVEDACDRRERRWPDLDDLMP